MQTCIHPSPHLDHGPCRGRIALAGFARRHRRRMVPTCTVVVQPPYVVSLFGPGQLAGTGTVPSPQSHSSSATATPSPQVGTHWLLPAEEVRQGQHVVRAAAPAFGLEHDDLVHTANGQLQIDGRVQRRVVGVGHLSGTVRCIEDHVATARLCVPGISTAMVPLMKTHTSSSPVNLRFSLPSYWNQ